MSQDQTQLALLTLGDIPPTGDVQELRALVARRDALLSEVAEVNALFAQDQAELLSRRDQARQPCLDDLSALDDRLKRLLVDHRRHFMNRFGKVINLPGGTIRYRVDAKSLDTPKVTTAIVNFLFLMRGGKKYLTVKWSLNRDALAHATEYVLAKLRPLGVRVVRHEHITIKSDCQDEPTTLVRRPYRVPSSKS